MTVNEAVPIQNPRANNLISRLHFKNKDKKAHKDAVDSYFSYWDVDRNEIHSNAGVQMRRKGSDKLTNHFYDLVTDFYEYGWGECFHFAPIYRDSSFAQCISRHENFLALKLNLKPSDCCLDVGCGVGGPMREIAKFSGAKIVGLNNNAYQIERCGHLNAKTGLDSLCSAVKGDFETMPFKDCTFDKAYSIESTCHSRALENPYKEIYRVLKPGGYYACYEWLTTPKYDESNLEHKQIIHNLEEGNSLPKLYAFDKCLNAIRAAGFEIVESQDLADPHSDLVRYCQIGWQQPLKGSFELSWDAASRWKMTPIGRLITDILVWILEAVRIAPPGTRRVSKMLNLGADSLVQAADLDLFTPMFYFLARKPLVDRNKVDR